MRNQTPNRKFSTVPEAPGALEKSERLYRWIEFLGLFFVVPGLFTLRNVDVPFAVALYSAYLACLFMLLRDETFDCENLWRARAIRGGTGRIVGTFAVAALVLAAGVKLLAPTQFLDMPTEQPRMWVALLLLYPILSVWPQNIIYRAFIFHRYERLFGSPNGIIWASALAFCWGHIIFQNWLALALTLPGGLIFAATYQRTRSGFLASLEHTMYGYLVFTVGLGESLYYATVHRG